jgi:hypothetical protein
MTEQITSTGHLGWTWTLEAGLAEVFAVGSSVCRAPANAPLFDGERRAGREWWPVGERYESLWRPLTWATAEEATSDMEAAQAHRKGAAQRSALSDDYTDREV